MKEETIESFRRFVAEKHHTYRKGILSAEAEMALINWMSQHKDTHIQAPNPAPKVALVWADVKKYMEEFYDVSLETGTTVMLSHIKRGIAAVRGSDPRTVRRWLRDFHRSGVIKELGGNRWEVM